VQQASVLVGSASATVAVTLASCQVDRRDAPRTGQSATAPGADRESLRPVVMLHGAGGVARSAVELLREEADRHRLLLLAPKSTAATWDVITGGYGPDVRDLDRLSTEVAAGYPLRGYTVGRFSDGVSYALSLGLTNGDVFDSVIAFSPGFEAAELANGRSRIFVSHGTEDRAESSWPLAPAACLPELSSHGCEGAATRSA
jgi:pimeloyl-ACP methyl ester carboxylesterase